MRRFGLFALVFVVLFALGASAVASDKKYEAKKAARTITIDGDLKEWAGVPSLSLTLPDGGKATLQAQWNEKAFYFAVTVEDKVHRNPQSGGNIWQGDNLQISLDTLNNKSAGRYDDDDFEFGWALTSKGLDSYAWHTSTAVTYDPAKAQFKVVNAGGRTIYEIALPIEQIRPAQLKAGTVMGFDWLVNDDDGSGRQFIEWTPGIGTSKDPSSYGSLSLGK